MFDFNFFKPFELDCFPEINNKLYQLHKDKLDLSKTNAVKVNWTAENFLELYDEINQLINPRKVMICRFFITPPFKNLEVHVDKDINIKAYALNIPIVCGEDNHFMNWYSYNGELSYNQTQMYNKSVHPREPEKLILEESLTIKKPTFVKVGIFHSVKNNSSVPRIILSIRFTDSFKI